MYTILADVKDRDGKVITKSIAYEITKLNWNFERITVSPEEIQKKGQPIEIEASVSGNIKKMQYKFVRMKDNWKEWGVIKEFDSQNTTTEWIPREAGDYVIYVDIRDIDGRKETITQHYSPKETDWKLEELNIHGERDRFVGDKLKISAVTSGNVEGLKYKFVCRRGNDWNNWEVIQGFSTKNSVEIPLNKDKDYHIYVDIKNEEGVICKTEVTTVRARKYLSAGGAMPIAQKGKSVKIYPNISGSQGTYQVKYVWMKNNWKEWGVIKDFSEEKSIPWSSNQSGDYTIFIDVKMNGIVQKHSVALKIMEYQNPSQYLQIRYTQKKLHGGGYNLSKGYMWNQGSLCTTKVGNEPKPQSYYGRYNYE